MCKTLCWTLKLNKSRELHRILEYVTYYKKLLLYVTTNPNVMGDMCEELFPLSYYLNDNRNFDVAVVFYKNLYIICFQLVLYWLTLHSATVSKYLVTGFGFGCFGPDLLLVLRSKSKFLLSGSEWAWFVNLV